MERIAIIGMGQIGGSIALAIKRAALKDIEVVGVARSRDTLRRSHAIGATDRETPLPEEAVAGARLVVVATPILAMRDIFATIAPHLQQGAVVTDAGSTKGQVARWAQELLPASVHFVGGHPMAGKETPGIDAADPDMFRDRPWVISPAADAAEGAVSTVIGLAQLCEARPIFMDADEHDAYTAAISHMPLVVSAALFDVVFGSQAWPEMAGLAAGGFRDTTRLASGSAKMAQGIMVSNRENVLHWLDRFSGELARLREIIAGGDEAQVLDVFARAQLERDNFMVNGPPERRLAGEPFERISFADMMMGSKLAGMMRKQQEILRDAEARADGKKK